MKFDEVKKYIKLAKDEGLSEFEIKSGDSELSFSFNSNSGLQVAPAYIPSVQTQTSRSVQALHGTNPSQDPRSTPTHKIAM